MENLSLTAKMTLRTDLMPTLGTVASAEAHLSSRDVAKMFMDLAPMAMLYYREEMRRYRGPALTIPQFRILAKLNRGVLNNKELAEAQGVSVAAMSRMIEGLVVKGYARRAAHPRDRRQVEIHLTAKGQAKYNEIRQRALLNLSEQFAELPELELEQMGRGIQSLLQGLAHIQAAPVKGSSKSE